MPATGRVLLSVTGYDPHAWERQIASRRAVVREPDGADDPTIRYAVAWKHPRGAFSRLPNLRAIFSIGAGVDHILSDPGLPDVPIVRVVADDLTRHMSEYVVWRVLDHHRQGMLYRHRQAQGIWEEAHQPGAPMVSVGILGLGTLGRAAAAALIPLGFRLRGWSRSGTSMEGVECFAGKDGLTAFLAGTDILVVLLPHTAETEGIVDYRLLSGLRRDNALGGPCLVNAGRGMLQKEADILRALDEGILKEASLDVFETEPLPASSTLWTHPRVFVTPHAAAASDASELVPAMLDQMDAHDRGEPLRNVVDRQAGY
jgi:glyoxylate/hydroxypyruvate reductase